ncbi:hypothetical protein DSO57_1008761 [Entomophthora muscae]|uniref:Uncharacterized protein n=1 Tax=Entomophthora muscae TaxID=34485 RepID=A0ACC2UG18_9FUNG|nr:hypothetical protein DSO57_1008761 [Entomophthora muscae]
MDDISLKKEFESQLAESNLDPFSNESTDPAGACAAPIFFEAGQQKFLDASKLGNGDHRLVGRKNQSKLLERGIKAQSEEPNPEPDIDELEKVGPTWPCFLWSANEQDAVPEFI